MFKNTKDVDKHVEKLISKLSVKEFKTRAFSIARLYFDVGDYANCQKYVEQHLTQKVNNAAAYKLLGQALLKMGQKDKALEQFKISLDIDQTQTATILDICELLADGEVDIQAGHAKYWFEKAEATFPKHPTTFRLRERLLTMSDPDPEALVNLLTMELNVRPKDAVLHARLLKHYLEMNQFEKAFEHSCNIEFSSNYFTNNYAWYEILNEVLTHDLQNTDKCLYQLLLLTVKERICLLSLTETPSGSSKGLVESTELLNAYDQAIERVARAGAAPGFAEFHTYLLQHHRGQFSFHAASLLLKKGKKGQISWSEATKIASPLMLLAWQTVPLDSKVNWLRTAPEKHELAVNRWYSEGTYRCSQSGHYLITNFRDKTQSLLDQISQCCSGSHWKEKLFEKLFTSKTYSANMKSSHITSNAFSAPQLRLPRKMEVEAYDSDAQKEYGKSLHHFVWTLLNYKNYAHFKCTLFEMLSPSVTSSGPETLNKLDIYAFLYCATLTAQQHKINAVLYVDDEKPKVLPANITDLLCPPPQMKWWDCAYKFSQNILGTELTDIRVTLSRGIEVVRCIDNHGLDPELLCILGRLFSDQAKVTTSVNEKNALETRAGLYYKSAVPLLEKLKSKIMIKVSDKRMFDYTHKEIEHKELNSLLEESKVFVAVSLINDDKYEKAIEILANVKSPLAYYHLAQAYKKFAEEERNSSSGGFQSKYGAMLSKAKIYADKALDLLKDNETYKNLQLYSDIQEIIEEIQIHINKLDNSDLLRSTNDFDFSDENMSYYNETRRTNSNIFRDISSTPKASSNRNNTNYRTAIDSETLDTTQVDQRNFERIENEIKNLQKKDTTITDFMEQTKCWFEENRNLGNKIINTINSNIQNTTEQFKDLKISVDKVKDQIDECRNECRDVGELRKQISELKKEVNKLKKASSEQTINESDLYNLGEDYRSSETTSNYASQLPYTPQMLPPFNARQPFPVPPNPYQLYNQTLYNLYNQYSHIAQPSTVPGAQPLFDPARAQMNFPGVYPTPEQMFLDMAHLIPPAAAAAPPSAAVPTVPVPHTLPTVPIVSSAPVVSAQPLSTSGFTPSSTSETKESSRSVPVNVVITSSDPLPTATSTPAPVLGVTIPQKHIKTSQPHNYQIALPIVPENKATSAPVFSFTMPENKNYPVTSLSNWNRAFQTFTGEDSPLYQASHGGDISKSVVDGPFSGTSPNTSLNKSRTMSEKSNTSVENYDPYPDFKPIIPLPAEVKVTTGEEDELVIFSSRAKLYRFVDKQWKERGLGEMKLLKHKITGKVRVLMRREQVHKICANHIITPEMEISPMKNETKAYIWVANDFAEEAVVLEKFCIRFKTADIAKQFYETFEKARQDAETSSTKLESQQTNNSESKIIGSNKTETQTVAQSSANEFSHGKTVIGGFTFSSTPIFKQAESENKTETKNIDTDSNKTNVFINLNFKTSSTPQFGSLFKVTQAPMETHQEQNKSNLNTSDTVEEFEPTVEFKPVIELPALVEQKTGEEDEISLFEHRAKLLRYDSSTKEWKERGLGNIKLLAHKDNNLKVRLVMRREQIMKVCCNHGLTKDITFEKMPKNDKAVTWCAKDFSDGELVAETFCLRFKTAQLCDDFINAVQTAQSKMKDNTKAAKEEQNVSIQTKPGGFGDQFKAKAGSWCCQSCYTNNLENFAKCACCEQPKPQVSKEDKPADEPKSTNWGDRFKPKPGSWECQSCFVRNEASVENCNACNCAKDPLNKKPTTTFTTDNKVSFSFGIPQQTAASIQNQTMAETISVAKNPPLSGFGDKFKPKEGSWECKQCFVRNVAGSEYCCACNSPQDPNAPQKSNSTVELTTATSVKFRFGIPPTLTSEEKPKPDSIFGGTNAIKFSFGIPSITSNETEKTQKPTGIIYDAPKTTTTNLPTKTEVPPNFSLKTIENSKTTPHTDVSNVFVASKETGFGFVFRSTATKSPVKPPHKQEDESDEEDLVEEDCSAHFNPVVPLPDKVEVVTGEEKEDELYGHRARLYIFVSGEWKERGTGIVKILKHKETNKLRVVMRREQVLKICLNHVLTPDIIYNPKDEKTWIFAANDFSEGELTLQKFCLRFSNKEIAMQFKNAVDNAIQGKPVDAEAEQNTTNVDQNVDEDVVFVSETQSSADDKQKAKDLMLPENFYMYKSKEPCDGCRGCSDDDSKSDTDPPRTVPVTALAAALAKQNVTTQASLVTPLKAKLPSFQSPANSVYGTPGNDKTLDTSAFRTPLGSIGSNTVTSSPSNSSTDTVSDATNKENLFSQKCSIFSNFGDRKSIFGTPLGAQAPLFGAGDSQTPLGTKSSLLAPPKLNTLNTSSEIKAPVTSIFSSAQVKPEFGESSIFGGTGISSNKSIFGFPADKPKDEANPEVKSIFGGNEKSINLFSGTSQGSIFGPGSLQPKSGGIFGSGETSIFGTSALTSTAAEPNKFSTIWGPTPADQKHSNELPLKLENSLGFASLSKSGPAIETKPDFKWDGSGQNLFGSGQKKESEKKEEGELSKPVAPSSEKVVTTGEQGEVLGELPLKIENNLTFAALSTSAPVFEKKADFKWEGSGQQLFASSTKKDSKNESGTGDDASGNAEEEFDPHYEPIVPLPDKIVVTTGEEDEKKIFGERGKIYRYDDKNKEWKERGVGELKILHHPQINTYRLLLRREQVHKAVLNMLIHMDLELMPMKNTETAWTFAGRNFAESTSGQYEMLAVRFKNITLANTFREHVVQCVRSLQAAAATAIREEKEAQEKKEAPATVAKDEGEVKGTKFVSAIAPLRLPKHLQDNARADMVFNAAAQQAESAVSVQSAALWTKPTTDSTIKTETKTNGDSKESTPTDGKQVHFQEEQEEEDDDDDDDENYEDHEYDPSDCYYNEEEAYYACEGEAIVKQGEEESSCAHASIQVLFDQDIYSPKVLVTDAVTGEILADMLIDTDTQFQLSGDSCKWTGTDYTSNDPVDKTVTINFYESESAIQFYDSVETSKLATFTTNDPDPE